MAFLLKVRSLLLTGLLSILLSVAMQKAAQTEPVLTTYYGEELAGNPTASGEPFNPYDLTAAHPYLPFGTMLTVTYNDRSVTVRVNDRGPFVPGRGLDLSLGAAQMIGLTDSGPAVVEVEPGETPEAKPPAPENETTEPARATRTSSSENRVANSMGEDSSSGSHKADALHSTISGPEAPLGTRLAEVREEQAIQTLYGRPAVLRRRSGKPLSEDVA
jgi:rare lipoprotein A